jgi:hypothetical protein
LGLTQFDPASLANSKEGTFTTPSAMKEYITKHLKHFLTKEEREVLFKEHPT